MILKKRKEAIVYKSNNLLKYKQKWKVEKKKKDRKIREHSHEIRADTLTLH